MVRHGPSTVVAVVLVLLGSVLQVLVSRRLAPAAARSRPASATVVNVVAPAAVLFTAAAVVYLRAVGLPAGNGAKATTVVIAAVLLASAAYTLVVSLVALAVAVARHGLRQAWASLWVVAATSVAAAVLIPIGWGR